MIKKIKNIYNVIQDYHKSGGWVNIVLNFLGIRKKIILIHASGIKVYAEKRGHSKIFQEMFKGELYNNEFLQKIALVNKNKIIIDIGAHVGSFSFWFDNISRTDNKFYLFEPDKNTFNVLEKNKQINNKENIILHQACVSSKSGFLEFHSFSKIGFGQSSSICRGGGEVYFVESFTIPQIIKKYSLNQIDLLKLDCEGAEYDILLNLPNEILENKIASIVMEYHDDYSKNNKYELVSLLEKYFKYVKTVPFANNNLRGILYAAK